MAARKRTGGTDAAEDRWRRLTWDDLEAWAGSRSLERGRSYQRSGRVKQLARTAEGTLLAWVQGTYRYATEVELLDEDGAALTSRCSCPVGSNCKHAVAVVVDYLDALREGREVPTAGASDRRLGLLDEGGEAEEYDEYDDEDYGENDDDEEWEEERPPAVRRGRRPPAEPAASGRKGRGKEADVRSYLEGLAAADLVAYVQELAKDYPEIGRDLKARSKLARGAGGELVREARREIRRLTAEPAWVNSWTGEGSLPDYSGLKRLFERLLELGQADALLELGQALLEAGTRQVGESHDEGETGTELRACLDVVSRAIPASTRSDPQKLLYVIDLTMLDEYDLVGETDVLDRDWPAEVWSETADQLRQRLQDLPRSGGDSFSRNYRRDRLSNWLVHALERAGRKAEILPLLEAEAPVTGSYVRLVEALLAARRTEDAKRRAAEGIARVGREWPGIAKELRERLRTLAEREKKWPLVAAMHAEEFFDHPSVHALATLDKAAEKAGCAAQVRAAALHFLETGKPPRPAPEGTVTRKARAAPKDPAAGAPPWLLPAVPPELRRPETERHFRREGPHFDVLLQMALEEKRPNDVLRWYDRLREGRRGGVGLEGRVADAVAETHPDRAADMYREIIAAFVAQTSPSAYEQALPYLRKLRALLGRLGRGAEWDRYLAGLRETERRKRRFMEVLDRIESRPIVDR